VEEVQAGRRRAAIGGRLRKLAPAAALASLVVLVLPGVFGGGCLYLRDINMVWLPQVESFVHGIAAGAWPLWDPYSGFGRPLLADPRAEILYPPNWLNLVLPPGMYYGAFTVGHLLLAAAGLWRLARREGLGPAAATTAAAVWTASGPLLSLVSMWHHLAAAAWMPWVVAAFDEAAVAGVTARRAARVRAAAVLAAQVLAGSPDVTALTLLVVALHAAWTVTARDGRGRRLGALAGAFFLGLGLSAGQWLPTLDVVRRSTRWAAARPGAAGAATWSLHPLAVLEMITPMRWADMLLAPSAVLAVLDGREPWMRSVYLGAAAAALVAAAVAGGGRRRWGLAAVCAAFVAFALGNHGPLYPLVAAVPGVSALRYPIKALLVSAMAWSLLAGCGLEAIASAVPRARTAAVATAAVLAAWLGATWAIAATAAPGRGPLGAMLAAAPPEWARRPVVIAALLVMALAVWVAAATRLSSTALAVGLAVLAAGDVAFRHRELNPTAPPALFAYRPEVLADVDRTASSRTYVYDYSMDPGVGARSRPWPYRLARQPQGWTPSASLVLAVQAYLNPPTAARWGVLGSFDLDILGFDPVSANRLVRYLREQEGTAAHARLLQIGAVGRVLAVQPAPWWGDLTPVADVPGFFEQPIRVFRVPDPLPRAYVVDGVRVADGEAALAMLTAPGFDPRREVVLATGDAHAPGADAVGTAAITGPGWDTLDLAVELRRDGRLVVVDAYDPGWRATVDGRPAPVERANVAFRSVPVPAGRHSVHLAYRPRAVGLGLAVSVLALLAAAWTVRGPRLAARPQPC
jgi:membrane protein YfhO